VSARSQGNNTHTHCGPLRNCRQTFGQTQKVGKKKKENKKTRATVEASN